MCKALCAAVSCGSQKKHKQNVDRTHFSVTLEGEEKVQDMKMNGGT